MTGHEGKTMSFFIKGVSCNGDSWWVTIYICIYIYTYTSNYKLCSEPVDIFLYNRKTSIIIKKKVLHSLIYILCICRYLWPFISFESCYTRTHNDATPSVEKIEVVEA